MRINDLKETSQAPGTLNLSKQFIYNIFWLSGREREKSGRISLSYYRGKKNLKTTITVKGNPVPFWGDAKVLLALMFLAQTTESPEVRVSYLKLLKLLGRGSSRESYSSLKESLKVLKNTSVHVEVELHSKFRDEIFSFSTAYSLIDEVCWPKERTSPLVVKLNEEFLNKSLGESFSVPIHALMDSKVKGFYLKLLLLGFYFFQNNNHFLNIGYVERGGILDENFCYKWFKEKITFQRLKKAVNALNSMKELPYQIKITKGKGEGRNKTLIFHKARNREERA
ncbi:hypothetical protein [Thermovibrio ammonificans]